ncbi:MAG: FeoA family protein [Planctomycetota bacterium]
MGQRHLLMEAVLSWRKQMENQNKETVLLSELQPGQQAKVARLQGDERFRKRLMEMGFISGTKIYIEKFAPLGDPGEYVLKGTHISLRKSDADNIFIAEVEEHDE